MKKLLTILGAVSIIGSASTQIIACTTESKKSEANLSLILDHLNSLENEHGRFIDNFDITKTPYILNSNKLVQNRAGLKNTHKYKLDRKSGFTVVNLLDFMKLVNPSEAQNNNELSKMQNEAMEEVSKSIKHIAEKISAPLKEIKIKDLISEKKQQGISEDILNKNVSYYDFDDYTFEITLKSDINLNNLLINKSIFDSGYALYFGISFKYEIDLIKDNNSVYKFENLEYAIPTYNIANSYYSSLELEDGKVQIEGIRSLVMKASEVDNLSKEETESKIKLYISNNLKNYNISFETITVSQDTNDTKKFIADIEVKDNQINKDNQVYNVQVEVNIK